MSPSKEYKVIASKKKSKVDDILDFQCRVEDPAS